MPNVAPNRTQASKDWRFRFISLSSLAHDRDLAAHHVKGFARALGLDQREVAAARDRPARAVLAVPHPFVEACHATHGAARERALQHQVTALREDAQLDR